VIMSVNGRIDAAKERDHRKWGAVIVAGGAGRRLGGMDKPALVVRGRTLLDTAIDACADAADIVVVGPQRPTVRPVRWTREDPPGSGPLAALAAGLDAVPADVEVVVVLAADLPGVTPELAHRLVDACRAGDTQGGAVVDDAGHIQPLVACYRVDALVAALNRVGDPRNRSMRSLLDQLRIVPIRDDAASADIDTAEDLSRFT
jgi:molybdopterin-guanine dinucleotide biosynthesis protein A